MQRTYRVVVKGSLVGAFHAAEAHGLAFVPDRAVDRRTDESFGDVVGTEAALASWFSSDAPTASGEYPSGALLFYVAFEEA